MHSTPSPTGSVRAFYDRAIQFRDAGDLDEAERLCRRAQAIYPFDPNIMCLLGEVVLRGKRPQEALSLFRQTLKQFPDFPRALEGSGRALLAQEKPRKAVTFLQQAAQALPRRYSTHVVLARALAAAGRPQEAAGAMQQALALNPVKAAVSRAAEAFHDARLAEAEKLLREVLATHPDDPHALRLLGQVATEANRPRPALRALRRAVELAPDFLLAWHDLANLHMKEERYEEALQSIDHAIALDPGFALSQVVRGNVLSRAQRHAEALDSYDRALAINPLHGGALAGKGHVLKTIGRTTEAIASYRECIRNHPPMGEAWWSLANLKTFRFEDGEVRVMEEMVVREELADEPRVNFHYALGKHYEHERDFDRAFGHYRAGADLRRGHEAYDPVQTQHLHDRIIEVFTPAFLAERTGYGDPASDPILVVGLPRSGSTLIEQILASHSQVEGTKELPDLARCVRAINRARKERGAYPEALRHLSAGDFAALGRQYLEATRRYRSGRPYFIDKMPNNFAMLGLLHLILPNAKVIDARRHPLDSCLGSWRQLFFKGQSFTYDFFELGQYYLEYRRLMDHWHRVLPGRVLEVHYEDVVHDLEGQTRRMLDYLGLPFEDACLRYWETERAINTASSEQVRQPIYTGALNYWRHYEHHLDELIEVLEPVLRQLPEGQRPESLKGVTRDS